MSTRNRQTVMFESIAKKPIHVKFDKPEQTSDGGLVILKSVDERMGLTQKLAESLVDCRQQGKIDHTLLELIRQRVYSIACGYPDCNDASWVRRDPVMRTVCSENGSRKEELGSQPTLSRFENAFTATDMLRMSYALAKVVIEEQKEHVSS